LNGVGELQAWSTDRPAQPRCLPQDAWHLDSYLLSACREIHDRHLAHPHSIIVDKFQITTREQRLLAMQHRPEFFRANRACPRRGIIQDRASAILLYMQFDSLSTSVLIERGRASSCQTLKSLRVAISDFLDVMVNTRF
jgi:hypothetical protein